MKNRAEHKDNIKQAVEQPEHDFYGLGIAPKILDILEREKFKVPTPIQFRAIPPGIQGKDIIGVAQTGTGKTLAFGIPMVQGLAQKKGTGLVLAPTRELAIQIDEALWPIAFNCGMQTACLIGGAPIQPQIKMLRKNPRVIIATPGRYLDHVRNWNVLPEEAIILVLDEADRMLDMGFAPQIDLILRSIPKERQTMLFSATIPPEIVKIAAKHMKLPVSVEIAPSGTAARRITQELFIVKKEVKLKLLRKLLAQYNGAVLLFTRTKYNAGKITRAIRNMNYSAAEIHSNRTLPQRSAALEGFKSGRYKVLVATDIAARGIDVTGIELVINFDLPDDAQNYVHRIGRTGRAGHEGYAISFATPDQKRDVMDIEKIIRTQLPIVKHPEISAQQFSNVPQRPAHKKFRKRFKPRPGRFHRRNRAGKGN